MPEQYKKKLFVSYSCQDRELVSDFRDRIEVHNPQFDILFDQNAASGGVDDILLGYASICDVALLLINAKFYDSEYCMDKELHLLRKRIEKGEVQIIPILFQDCDYMQFNQKPTFFFFQVRNHEFRFTRRGDPNSDKFNNQYAIYEEIEKQDREKYHRLLHQWIDKVLLQKTEESKNIRDATVEIKISPKEMQDIAPSTSLADEIKNEEEMKDYFTTNRNLISSSISELIDLMDELDYEQSSFEDDLEVVLKRATNLVNRLSPLLNLSEKSRLKVQFENLTENLALLKSSWQNLNTPSDAKKIQDDIIPKFGYTLEKVHNEFKIDARLLN